MQKDQQIIKSDTAETKNQDRTEETPLEIFERNPTLQNFVNIEKRIQTPGIIQKALDHYDGKMTILQHISKTKLTYEICFEACKINGQNLKYVPESWIDYNICSIAVQNDKESCGFIDEYAISYVPSEILNSSTGRTLCKLSVEHNGLSIVKVPKKYITKKMAWQSIENVPTEEKIYVSRWPIGNIPHKFLSKELIELSILKFPESFKDIPLEYITEELCFNFVKRDGRYIGYIPEPFCDENEIIDAALEASPSAIFYINREQQNIRRYLKAVEKEPSIWLHLPEHIQKEYKSTLKRACRKMLPKISIPMPDSSYTQASSIQSSLSIFNDNVAAAHRLELKENKHTTQIYYISDVHLEYQLKIRKKISLFELLLAIEHKVNELVESIPIKEGIILIAGNVADSFLLEKIFYMKLYHKVPGMEIINVLGNPVLQRMNQFDNVQKESLKNTIESYKENIKETNILENELYIKYKGIYSKRISEENILSCDTAKLTRILENSSLIILGGIGLSEFGSICSEKQDFQMVYDKVMKCAGNKQVIVLTYMPVINETEGLLYNPNWIYVCGYNYPNIQVRPENKINILTDNRVGRRFQKLHFNYFTINDIYDPFEKLEDGVYKITRTQYLDFNNARRIDIKSFKREGDLFVIKCSDLYMFFLKGQKLYILCGGSIRTAEHNIEYYVQKLPLYCEKLKEAFNPYYDDLKIISDEVKKIGGEGRIHGCIVDIDFYNHIYLNPFDRQITPYFAFDITNKFITDYDEADFEPILVKDRSMYKSSRLMRTIQYILDQDVVRIWDDNILENDIDDKILSMLDM